jgi:hypothetical protein
MQDEESHFLRVVQEHHRGDLRRRLAENFSAIVFFKLVRAGAAPGAPAPL